jgi:hypothetical protein
MNTDDAVAATNPYPRRTVDGLPLDAASQVLLEEIMSKPTATRARTVRPPRRRTSRRWIAPVAAAAVVAAVVAGSVALTGGRPSPSEPGSPPIATQSSASPVDPSLPPTAGNLHQVLLLRDGWSVDYMSDSRWGGSIRWARGADTLEMTWYETDEYDTYLADRRADGTESAATLLGQDGRSFDMGPVSQGLEVTSPTEAPTEASDSPPTLTHRGGATPHSDGIRVMTILPPVGDWFLEFDAFVGSDDEYADVMASLTRVERGAWLSGVDNAGVVVPAEGDAFLQEAGQDVPMPEGVSVTVDDLQLPQDAYQARSAFVAPVLCGWAAQYAAGKDAALAALRGSASWPVMQAMARDGDYPSAVAEDVEQLAADRSYEGWRQGWGC